MVAFGMLGVGVWLKVVLNKPGSSRNADFKMADEKLEITKVYRKEHKLTWHHQDPNKMMLIPTDLHSKVYHTGGFKIWGARKA